MADKELRTVRVKMQYAARMITVEVSTLEETEAMAIADAVLQVRDAVNPKYRVRDVEVEEASHA